MLQTISEYKEDLYKYYAFVDLTWIRKLYGLSSEKLIYTKDFLPFNNSTILETFNTAQLISEKPVVFEYQTGQTCMSGTHSKYFHGLTMVLTQAAFEMACMELAAENIVFPDPQINVERWKEHLLNKNVQTQVGTRYVRQLKDMGGLSPFTTDFSFVTITKWIESAI